MLPFGLHPTAITWDNDDIKPTMGVKPGSPCVAFIGAIIVGSLPHQNTLSSLANREDFQCREKVAVDMVAKGQDRKKDVSTSSCFESSLFLASWNAWRARHDDSQMTICINAELRKWSASYSRLKRFEGSSKHVIDRLTTNRDVVIHENVCFVHAYRCQRISCTQLSV